MFCFLVQISLPSLIKLKVSRMVIAYDIFSTKTCRTVPLIVLLFLRGGRGHPCLRTNQEPCKTCALHAKQATCEYARFAHVSHGSCFCSVVTEQSILANRTRYCSSIFNCQQKREEIFWQYLPPEIFLWNKGATEVELRLQPPKTGK